MRRRHYRKYSFHLNLVNIIRTIILMLELVMRRRSNDF
jgi:hypothetical protein